MKKTLKASLAVLLAAILCLLCFAGCASRGKTMMQLKEDGVSVKLSVNLFQLFLSRMKGALASSYGYGSSALSEDFWDTMMRSEDGTYLTYNDYYTAQILDNAKTYLAALYEFEKRDLKLPDETIEEIDEELKRLMEEDAGGSKAQFNSLLKEYGVNYQILRDAYILEAKIEYLKTEICGANGTQIDPGLVESYYQQNYRRFKQVFLYTYDYVYQTDKDENFVLDENGEKVPVIDEDGSALIDTLPTEELEKVRSEAQQIAAKVVEGDYVGFDALVEQYSLDAGMEKYPGGYYLTATTDYDSPEVVEKLFELEEGEWATVTSEYGIHIIMRYENEEAAYNDSENSDFFISTTTGNYVFMNDLIDRVMADYLAQFKELIVVDEAVLAEADMKSVGANFYY